MSRLRCWLIRALVGKSWAVFNVTVIGGIRCRGPGTAANVLILGANDEQPDPYEWFTPMRPPRGGLDLRS